MAVGNPQTGTSSGGASLERAAEQTRRFSPAFFAVIGLCFLLPFVSVTCSGQRVASIKGIDLVVGGKVEVDPQFEESLKEFESGFDTGLGTETETAPVTEESPFGGAEGDRIDPSIFAIAAMAGAVLGVILTLVLRGRPRSIGALAAAALVIIGLIAVRFDLGGDMEESQGLIALDYRLGYWTPIILALLLIVLHGLALRRGASAASAGGHQSGYGPPGGEPHNYGHAQQGGYGGPPQGGQQGGYGGPPQGGYGGPPQGGYGGPPQGGQQGAYGGPPPPQGPPAGP